MMHSIGVNLPLMDLQKEVTQSSKRGEQLLYFPLYGDVIFPILHCIFHCFKALIANNSIHLRWQKALVSPNLEYGGMAM